MNSRFKTYLEAWTSYNTEVLIPMHPHRNEIQIANDKQTFYMGLFTAHNMYKGMATMSIEKAHIFYESIKKEEKEYLEEQLGLLVINDPEKTQDICARSVCLSTEAIYFNHSTKKLYCKKCAIMINKNNSEYQRINKHHLCEIIN